MKAGHVFLAFILIQAKQQAADNFKGLECK